MYSILTTNENNHSLGKLSAQLINKTTNITSSGFKKAESGFISLLKSISNSFKCIVRLFSFSKGSSHLAKDTKSSIFYVGVPSVVIEAKEAKTLEDNISRASHQIEFHKLRTKIHEMLGVYKSPSDFQ